MLFAVLAGCASGKGAGGEGARYTNEKIVFILDGTTWTINANGSNLRHLTEYQPDPVYFPDAELSPEWSPDGKKILFTKLSEDCAEGSSSASATSSAEPTEGPSCIYVMNADGSNQKELVDTPGEEPSWSPDGSKIAFAKSCEIYIMNSDGSGRPTKLISREPTPSNYCYLSPEWSPDGKKLAVVGPGDGPSDYPGTDIYIMNVSTVEGETKEPVKLTDDSASAIDPVWSPDGSEIAFSGQQPGGLVGIYKMNADGSEVARLTNSDQNGISPAWSPDGEKIAYVKMDRYGRAISAIYVMNSDGSNPTLIKKFLGEQMGGAFGRAAVHSLDWRG